MENETNRKEKNLLTDIIKKAKDHPYFTAYCFVVMLLAYATDDLSGRSSFGFVVIGLGIIIGSFISYEENS